MCFSFFRSFVPIFENKGGFWNLTNIPLFFCPPFPRVGALLFALVPSSVTFVRLSVRPKSCQRGEKGGAYVPSKPS